MVTFEPIGIIRGEYDEPGDPHEMRQSESRILVDEAYEEGLYRFEQNEYVIVLFHLHESGDYTLVGPRRYGEERGTFACRSPHRPNAIGMTTVELLHRDGRELHVKGLDAIDGTPVLDIKPHAPALDHPDRFADDERREAPRAAVESHIRNRDMEALLLDAGALHGHFCPHLSLGVIAGVFAQRELGLLSHDQDDVECLAVLETNNCFADGIQFATGCTFGNGKLVFWDWGKTAFTLANLRSPDDGIRIHVRQRDDHLEEYPEAADLFERVVKDGVATDSERERFDTMWTNLAFEFTGRPIREFCDIETEVSIDVPSDAGFDDSTICVSCGEQVDASKAVGDGDEKHCVPCAGVTSYYVDRRGIHASE